MGEMIDGEGGSFSSRWTLGGMLGRGHSARIFMAHDSQSGGTAACKLARHAPGMNWTRVVRAFEREAVLLKRCAHPNVVEFLGLFQGDTDVALVLSLAPSGDCQQLLQRHGALAERAATAIAQQVCSALDHIHTTARCLHRDVKLENVLVLNTGGVSGSPPRVQLCDFGHSCTIDPPHVDGAAFNDGFRGTEGYTAPEILVGSPWTTAADGWGLGVVYYALLANELLRWKPDGTPDVSTKTSRAFSQVTPSCKMRVKALLVTEPAERIELGMLNSMLLAALSPTSLPTSPTTPHRELELDISSEAAAPSAFELSPAPEALTEGLRRSDVVIGGMGGKMRRNAYSLSTNLYALGSGSASVGVGRVDAAPNSSASNFSSQANSSYSPSPLMSKNASAVSSLEQFGNTAGPSGSIDVSAGTDLAALIVGDDVDAFERSEASGGAAATSSSGGRGLEERFEGSLRIDRRSRTRSYEMEEEPACGRGSRDEGGHAHRLPNVPVTPATLMLPGTAPPGVSIAAGAARPPVPGSTLPSKSQRTAKLLAALARAQHLDNVNCH